MPDQPVAELGPLLPRNKRRKGSFDLHGIRFAGDPESARETENVGVDDNALFQSKGVAQNHVRSLPAHPGKRGQGVQGPGDFAAVLLHERLAGGFQVLRLVPEQSEASKLTREVLFRGRCVVRRGAVLAEQRCRHAVHVEIGALGGQDGGDEEFERIPVHQLAMGVWVDGLQNRPDAVQSFPALLLGFPAHGREILFWGWTGKHESDVTLLACKCYVRKRF